MSEAFPVPFHPLNQTLLHKSSWLIKPGPWSQSYIFFGDQKPDTVHHKLSSWELVWDLQDKVRTLRALENAALQKLLTDQAWSLVLQLNLWRAWFRHHPPYVITTMKTDAAVAAKSLQLCLTPCNPRDSSPPGSPIPGILQARTLEWVAISFSNAWKWKVQVKSLSRVQLLATPWTAAYQALPSKRFSRQEYWSGLPLPSPL